MSIEKEYTVQLLLSHYETVTVKASSEDDALAKATYMCNTQDRYSRDYSSVYSAEIKKDT